MTKLIVFLISALTVSLSCVCDSYRILLICPLPSKSHGILGKGIVRHLLNANHEVYYITPYVTNNTNPNLHEIDVSSHFEKMKDHQDITSFDAIMKNNLNIQDQTVFTFLFGDIAKMTVEHKNVQKILRDPNQHFDVVIAEWMFNELYSGIAHLFNAPLIWFSTMEPHWMVLNLIDEYTNPAYDGYFGEFSPPFTFMQRLSELWETTKMTAVRETIASYLQTSAYNNLIAPIIQSQGRVAPSFSELRYNASLVLGNSHVSMGQATRLPQSYKPIGGYHIEEEVKPLPRDLKRLMDTATDGVIYFSMGSNLRTESMPDKLKRSILDMFGTLNQTVLWKVEEKVPNVPKNVHILNWAPQQSILAHPNCIHFITHGGLLSTTETVFTGKPIIGIPVFADQFVNVARAVSKGFALKVDLSYTMAVDMKTAIVEMLSNPKYAQKAKDLSLVYHDRIATPGKELVHWVEHVVKTGGAPHLRSPAVMMPWYQKIYLDFVLLVIIVIVVLRIEIKRVLSLIQQNNGSKKNN